MKKWNQKWTVPVKVLLAGAGIAVAAILVPLVVSAVAPAANTVIRNQASVSYVDANSKPQSATSNEVSTTVAQIGGVTLSNDGTKSAAAGNTVYIPHTVTNTGNGTDSFTITSVDSPAQGTFSNIAIYADTNGTGVPSGAPLCATPLVSGVPLCTAGFIQPVGGNGGVFNFVAAYTIPTGVTTPTTPFDTATVTVVPVTSTPSIPYPAGTVTRTDTVNLTTLAAFASSKSIAAPAVAAPGATSGGWPAVVTGGYASSSASCATAWSTGLTSTSTCTYTVYTINYNNTGASAGTFSMSDTLPSGLTYVTGSAVWSGKGGTALNEAGVPLSFGGSTVTTNFAAGKLTATVSNVLPSTAGTISFVVLVNSTAAAGSSTTTNTALYSTTDCPSCTPDVPTNPSPFPVTPTYKVIAANVSTATTFDSTPGAPAKTGVDIETIASAFLGNKVSFNTVTPLTSNFVINKGNVDDTFNLSVDAGNYPAGTTFAFFKSDGATPLLDTNGDGKPDTGLLAPGAFVEIRVVATLPATATLGTGPYDALMTATSAGAAASGLTVIDSVWERVTTILSAKVDLTNTPAGNKTSTDGGTTLVDCIAGSNCDLGQGPSTAPTFTTPTTPGTSVSFPIYIKNQEPTDSTYNLTGNVPPGWTVKFVPSTGTCASPAVAQPLSVTTGTQVEVLACVTPPVGTSPATTPVTFTATKSTDPTVSDTITDAVKVTLPVIPGMELGPLTSSNSTPNGGTTVQPETLTNTGTTACGQTNGFHVSVALDSASQAAGWTASVYYDANKNGAIDPADVLIDTSVGSAVANLTTAIAGSLVPLNPAPGNTLGLPLLLKTFAPLNATIGSTATATMTVTDLNTVTAQTCPPTTATISTKVTNGQLTVTKAQVLSAGTGTAPAITCSGNVTTGFDVAALSAKPGDCIVYKVVATNTGNANVTGVMLNDAVPAFTVYNATQVPAQCVASGASGGTPTFATAGTPVATVSCGNSTTGVTLPPLSTMTMYYAVQVQQ